MYKNERQIEKSKIVAQNQQPEAQMGKGIRRNRLNSNTKTEGCLMDTNRYRL